MPSLSMPEQNGNSCASHCTCLENYNGDWKTLNGQNGGNTSSVFTGVYVELKK